MRALAIALAALLPCVASAQSLEEPVTGGQSAVASRYQFGSTGGDWPVPPEAPAPIVDCRGDFRSGSCGPTTFTPSGSPGLAATYWRPGGGSTPGSGVAFDGADDFLDAGDVGDQAGSFTLCVLLATSDAAGHVVSKDGVAVGRRSWGLSVASGAMFVELWDGAGTLSSLVISPAIAARQEIVTCLAYEYLGSGAVNALRANTAGNAYTAGSIVGPLANTDTNLRIGARDYASVLNGLAGSISRVTLWSGWAASSADLARMVRSQYAAQGSLGEPVTVTRASAKSCPIGGQWFTVPSGQPCIGDAGLSVEGSRINAQIQSEGLSVWSKANITPSADAIAGPTGAATADLLAATASGSAAYVSGTFTATAAQWTCSVFLRAGTVTTATVALSQGTGIAVTPAVTQGPGSITGSPQATVSGISADAWTRVSITTTANLSAADAYFLIYPRTNVAANIVAGDSIYATGAQCEAGSTASSYIPTTTTPVTRQADVLSVPIPTGALWAVYTLDGTRTALDLTGNTTPLTIGVGQELNVTGNVTNLTFCYAPDSSECI